MAYSSICLLQSWFQIARSAERQTWAVWILILKDFSQKLLMFDVEIPVVTVIQPRTE